MSFHGWRLVREREWSDAVVDREAVRAERDQLRAALAQVLGAELVLADRVNDFTAEAHERAAQIRQAITTVLACNIRLAHRAETAEAVADDLRRQLVEVLNRP